MRKCAPASLDVAFGTDLLILDSLLMLGTNRELWADVKHNISPRVPPRRRYSQQRRLADGKCELVTSLVSAVGKIGPLQEGSQTSFRILVGLLEG